jgi:hypothetical protein
VTAADTARSTRAWASHSALRLSLIVAGGWILRRRDEYLIWRRLFANMRVYEREFE